jgi:hypothetical protein
MNASHQKSPPLYTPEIYDQVIDLPVEKPRLILIPEKEYLELKSEVGYWQAMHKKAILREKNLKETVKVQEGKIRDLRNRLFGKKTEKGSSDKNQGKIEPSTSKRPRGQQPGSKGHARTAHPDLPQREETVNFPETPTYKFGIKDLFYNEDHTPSGLYGTDYYHNYSSSLELQISDLFEADPYVVIQGGLDVYVGSTRIGDFNTLMSLARQENGWIRTLEETGERILAKAAVLGGIVLTPSFVPNDDVCGFGGESYLYAQYYETGTAYYKPVFLKRGTKTVNIDGEDRTQVLYKVLLGEGMASAVGVHAGAGVTKALIQQSTGTILSEELDPAFNIKSGLRSWIQR